MTGNSFRIVTTGQVVSGFDRALVERNLAQLCKFGPDKLAQVFSGTSVTLKSGLDRESAQRYLNALTKAGIVCRAERASVVSEPVIELYRDIPSIALQGADLPQVTCPKCGTVQPKADSCSQCQVFMAKYRPPQAPHPAAPYGGEAYVEPVEKAGAPVGKILLALAVVGVSTWLLMANPFNSKAGKIDASAGRYVNEKYHFALAFPQQWNSYSVNEAIACKTIRSEYADQYLLLISPSNPDDRMMVVNFSGTPLKIFNERGWDGMLNSTGKRHKILYDSVDEIGGFKLYRMGYDIANSYREDAYFETNDTLIQIYFYVKRGPLKDAEVAEMRSVLLENLRAI